MPTAKKMYSITLTITAKKDEFDSFLAKEFSGERFFTVKREDITSWGVEGMVCKFTHDDLGDTYAYEKLLSRYPSLFLKIEWTSGSKTGICICQSGVVQHMEWVEDDLCFRSH